MNTMTLPSIEPSKLIVHLALALGGSMLVLAGLFYASSQAGHDINPARLMELIKSSSIGFFLLYVVTMVIGLVFRAWRYLVLLRATGDKNIPSAKDMTLITAVRNMTVDLLPARLGELVFVALLRRQAGTEVSSGLSTLLFATLLDVLILAPFTIAIGLMVGFPTKQPYLLALIALFVVVAFVVGVKFILPHFTVLFERWAGHRNRLISGTFKFVLSIDQAVQSTLRAGIFTQVIGLTAVIRFMKYAGLLCLFYGLTQTNFPQMAQMGALKVLGALIASEMTASLPMPALMSFGTWELGGMTLLAFFGAMPQNALLTMLSLHIQTQALDYGIGIAAFAALLLLAKRVRTGVNTGTKAVPKRAMLYGFGFLLIAAVLSWFGIKESQVKNAEFATQQAGEFIRPTDSPAPAWLNDVNGHIVWSSNRSGNHDIWMMSLPDMRIRQLTTDPHTENFARLSPDGSKVVFARSHQEWQSMRDKKPWDVWMLDITTGDERLIAKNGISPSWSPDGRFILFQRDPAQIMVTNLETGKEQLFYESGKDPFMKSRVNLSTPTMGEGLRMAFTFRNNGQPTNIIRDEVGKFHVVHRDSCQAQWVPSGEYVTYIQKGGKQINQLMRYDPKTQEKTTLLDLPGEFSHEYFARFSDDERYVVFAASSGGHEHDLADYEIFLWPMGEPAEQATRLTFNSGNDSWPDIWLKQ